MRNYNIDHGKWGLFVYIVREIGLLIAFALFVFFIEELTIFESVLVIIFVSFLSYQFLSHGPPIKIVLDLEEAKLGFQNIFGKVDWYPLNHQATYVRLNRGLNFVFGEDVVTVTASIENQCELELAYDSLVQKICKNDLKE